MTMTTPIMTSRDVNLVAASIDAQNRQALERLFDEVINARIKLGYSLKLCDADRESHCRFFDLLLLDTLSALSRGVILGHPTPRTIPKPMVFLAQLYRERFKGCSEEMVMTLGSEFRSYLK